MAITFIKQKNKTMALEYAVLEGNPFSENTYVLYDETRACIIIDPGCYNVTEEKRLRDLLEAKCLKPVQLINTHCHIDHVLGNDWVFTNYQLKPQYHKLEVPVMEANERVAQMYGIPYTVSPVADTFIHENETITFGNTSLEVRLTPGHSPGSLCFINHEHELVIGGDVLFYHSIGRTDLPGGDHQTLLKSIREQLFTLPDTYKVLPGHGNPTTIGEEKKSNPFLQV